VFYSGFEFVVKSWHGNRSGSHKTRA
jgi:hypothetical protein